MAGAGQVDLGRGGKRLPDQCHGSRNTGFFSYTPEEIDILVVNVLQENAWYVIPVKAFTPHRSWQLHPTSGGPYEKYREAWGLTTSKERIRLAKYGK